MDIPYTFTITKLDTTPSQDNLTNVVKAVCWNFKSEVDGYKTILYGLTVLSNPEVEHFTNYNEITKEQAEAWVLPYLDIEDVKSRLQKNIVDRLEMDIYQRIPAPNPVAIKLPLPWASA